MNQRLDPTNFIKNEGKEEFKTLQDALNMSADGVILKALHSGDLGQRY
jgi:hypothetical protein